MQAYNNVIEFLNEIFRFLDPDLYNLKRKKLKTKIEKKVVEEINLISRVF